MVDVYYSQCGYAVVVSIVQAGDHAGVYADLAAEDVLEAVQLDLHVAHVDVEVLLGHLPHQLGSRLEVAAAARGEVGVGRHHRHRGRHRRGRRGRHLAAVILLGF